MQPAGTLSTYRTGNRNAAPFKNVMTVFFFQKWSIIVVHLKFYIWTQYFSGWEWNKKMELGKIFVFSDFKLDFRLAFSWFWCPPILLYFPFSVLPLLICSFHFYCIQPSFFTSALVLLLSIFCVLWLSSIASFFSHHSFCSVLFLLFCFLLPVVDNMFRSLPDVKIFIINL